MFGQSFSSYVTAALGALLISTGFIAVAVGPAEIGIQTASAVVAQESGRA